MGIMPIVASTYDPLFSTDDGTWEREGSNGEIYEDASPVAFQNTDDLMPEEMHTVGQYLNAVQLVLDPEMPHNFDYTIESFEGVYINGTLLESDPNTIMAYGNAGILDGLEVNSSGEEY
jgi:hypothetical protein